MTRDLPLTARYPERPPLPPGDPAGRVTPGFTLDRRTTAPRFAAAVLAMTDPIPNLAALRHPVVSLSALQATMGHIAQTSARVLGMLPHAVQLQATYEMLQGKLVEMETGEGKTLVAGLIAAAHGLAGRRVHVITANDYLAGRDAVAMAPLFAALGLTVGSVLDGMDDRARRAGYGAQITYLTAKQVMFDHLRDRISFGARADNRLRRDLHVLTAAVLSPEAPAVYLPGLEVAVIDEADSVLIDEAVVPLILSRQLGEAGLGQISRVALDMASGLQDERDFRRDPSRRDLWLTEAGCKALEGMARPIGGVFLNALWREQYVLQALMALHLFERDRDYILRDGVVQIVDVNTGRTMKDRSWERGLHQMIEAKEGAAATSPNETIARTSSQTFFRRYLRLCGMSGTLSEVRRELGQVYGVDFVRIGTRLPSRRDYQGVRVLPDTAAKLQAVAARAAEVATLGRPVLIGTRTVADSEAVSGVLTAAGVAHRLLNARQDAGEAAVLADAGGAGIVTVATNMAGRGTDITLGAGVVAAGGLHVILTARHESHRVDRQLFGRAARQGDPGSCEEIISLEDDIARRYMPRLGLALLKQLGSGRLADMAVRLAQRRADQRSARQRIDLARQEAFNSQRLAFAGAGVALREG